MFVAAHGPNYILQELKHRRRWRSEALLLGWHFCDKDMLTNPSLTSQRTVFGVIVKTHVVYHSVGVSVALSYFQLPVDVYYRRVGVMSQVFHHSHLWGKFVLNF